MARSPVESSLSDSEGIGAGDTVTENGFGNFQLQAMLDLRGSANQQHSCGFWGELSPPAGRTW